MLRKELKNTVLALVRERGCVLISTILKELDYPEDMIRQGDLYEVLQMLALQNKLSYTMGSHGYVRVLPPHYH